MSATGRPASNDEEVLQLFRDADDPVLTASEIAEQLDLTRQAINYRLNRLEEAGAVERKRIGSRAVAWWLA